MRNGQVLIGASDPLTAAAQLRELADAGATLFAMELIPRITRAQSMDILSSMATVAGYKAVLIAAAALPRMFPLLMTAAGTLTPARVLVIGAGVAGLQAIATARRLGAVVQAYDVRPAVKDQIESLGAEFIELDIDAGDSEDAGGYAKAQDETFYNRQREELAKVARANDVLVVGEQQPRQLPRPLPRQPPRPPVCRCSPKPQAEPLSSHDRRQSLSPLRSPPPHERHRPRPPARSGHA